MTEPEKRRYKLPNGLSAMHQKSLRRLYGTQGAQVQSSRTGSRAARGRLAP